MNNSPQNRKKICRLCLIKCDNFEVIDRHTKDNLDLLLLKMNLFVSDEPVMCKNCTGIVKKCLDFKAKCLDTCNYIVSFTSDESNAKMDLKKVYLRKKEDVIDIPKDYNICALCMNLVKSCSAVCLDNKDGDNMLHKTILPKCLPELDLSIIEAPVICAVCYASLNDYFHLVTNCSLVEENIKKYCKSQNMNEKCLIALANVLQFTSGNISPSKEDDNAVDIVKKETFYADLKNVDQLVENRNENFMKTDNQQLKNEPLTSKTVWICEEKYKIAEVIKTEGEFYAEQANNVEETNEHVDMEDQKFVHQEDFEVKIDKQDFNRFQDGVVEQDGNPTSTHENFSHSDPLELLIHQCDACSYQAKDKWTLETHNLMHEDTTEITLYQCESCFYQTKQRGNLKKHKLEHKILSEVTSYQCTFCTFETKHKKSLRDHLLLHKPPSEITMFQCESCPFKAKYKKSILKHARRTHNDESQMEMYQCETCSFQTKYKDSIKRHSLIHKEPSEVLTYQCDACSYQTRRKSGLKMHSLIHRDTSEVTMYHCDYCTYQSKYKNCLEMHILIHKDCSEVIMYQCDLCLYQAKTKYALEKHRLVHKDSSQVTMYECDCCSYKTKYKRSLKRHMLIHRDPSEIPMFHCESCSYKSKFKTDISRHLLTHKTVRK